MGNAVDMDLQAAEQWIRDLEELNMRLQTLLNKADTVVNDIAASGQGGVLDHLVDSFQKVTEASTKLVNAFGDFARSLGDMFKQAAGLVGEINELIGKVGLFGLGF